MVTSCVLPAPLLLGGRRAGRVQGTFLCSAPLGQGWVPRTHQHPPAANEMPAVRLPTRIYARIVNAGGCCPGWGMLPQLGDAVPSCGDTRGAAQKGAGAKTRIPTRTQTLGRNLAPGLGREEALPGHGQLEGEAWKTPAPLGAAPRLLKFYLYFILRNTGRAHPGRYRPGAGEDTGLVPGEWHQAPSPVPETRGDTPPPPPRAPWFPRSARSGTSPRVCASFIYYYFIIF